MLTFILSFLIGFFFVSIITENTKIFERIFVSFPIGIGTISFILFLYNMILGVFTINTIYIICILLIIISLSILYYQKKLNSSFLNPLFSFKIHGYNLWVLAFLTAGLYIVYGIVTKCLYFPTTATDSIEGYDLLAKAIAHEGTILNSIIKNESIVKSCGPRLLYPPLIPYANSFCYISGMEYSNIPTALIYLSFFGAYFTLLTRLTNKTNASFFTFMTFIIPEFSAQSSLNLTNMPTAFFAVIGVMSILIWYKEGKQDYLNLAIILFFMMMWTRNDSIFVFLGVQFALLLLNFKSRNFKPNLFLSISLLSLFTWYVYSKLLIPVKLDNIFISHFFYDENKFGKVIDRCWGIITDKYFFGITTQMFILVLLFHFRILLSKKDNWFILTIIFFSLITYTLIFYQVRDQDGLLFLENGGWIDSGYKRGLLNYLPLFFVYIATAKYVANLFDYIDSKL